MVIFNRLYSIIVFFHMNIINYNIYVLLLFFIIIYGCVIGFYWLVTVVSFFNYFVIFDNNMKFIKIL